MSASTIGTRSTNIHRASVLLVLALALSGCSANAPTLAAKPPAQSAGEWAVSSMLSDSPGPPGQPGADDPGVSTAYRLGAEAAFTGYYWLRNESVLPRSYRVFCLVDYNQTAFEMEAGVARSRDVVLAAGEDRWWTLKIPDLAPGRHDLIVVLVWEPEVSGTKGYGLGVSSSRVTVTVGTGTGARARAPLPKWDLVPRLTIDGTPSAPTVRAQLPTSVVGNEALYIHLEAPAKSRWRLVAFADREQLPLSAQEPSLLLEVGDGPSTARTTPTAALRGRDVRRVLAIAFAEPGRPLDGATEPQVLFGTVGSNRVSLGP